MKIFGIQKRKRGLFHSWCLVIPSNYTNYACVYSQTLALFIVRIPMRPSCGMYSTKAHASFISICHRATLCAYSYFTSGGDDIIFPAPEFNAQRNLRKIDLRLNVPNGYHMENTNNRHARKLTHCAREHSPQSVHKPFCHQPFESK